MKQLYILFIIILLGFGKIMNAQLSYGGKPLSFEQKSLKNVSAFKTPEYNYQKLISEDNEQSQRSKPYRYGKNHEVNLSPENSGSWNTLANGEKIWQLRINSTNAFSIGLIFNQYKLNPGVKMFIFSLDKQRVIGSFTQDNNKNSGWFSTIPLAGDEIIIELDVPINTEYGQLNLSGIVHDYKNAFGLKTGYGASGSCNVNINCPEGADWQDEKRSVVKYSFVAGFAELCTGVLINNTAYNSKPYLLTAEHCISSQNVANTAVFMFNYESENCVATGNPAYKSLSTATLLATGGDLDFTLLELNDNPPASYNIYLAGWNRGTNPAQRTVTIHHPQGDIKKISKDNEPPIIENYGSGYLLNSHWNIIEWDLGTTEGGSSGSPLFDENHRIVGDLTGGDASCSYNFNDYYSRFDLSWDHYAQISKQLKAWLDPLNSGAEVLDGFDPNLLVDGTDIGIIQVKSPNNTYCADNQIVPEVIIQNKGSVDLTSAIVNYKLNSGNIVSQAWNGTLKPFETVDFRFDSIETPLGSSSFKAFTSAPNGSSDLNHSNDTLYSSFVGEEPLEDIKISGNEEICSQSLTGNYSTHIQGKYLWGVDGGSIQGLDTLQSIKVTWNEWGERMVRLEISNLCNAVDAEPLEVDIVEQSLEFQIVTGNNGSSVCWSLEDCDGNILYQDCNLEPNKRYTEDLCLHKGCYYFHLNCEINGVSNYSIHNKLNGQLITEGFSVNGTVSEEFSLDPSSNLAKFNVYPNPAQNELVIEGSFMELYSDSEFAIFMLNGSMVTPFAKLDERKSIDISTLPKGMYIIQIINSYGKFSKKFTKP